MKRIKISCFCGKTVATGIEFDVKEKLKCPRCETEYVMKVKKGEDVPVMTIQQKVNQKYFKAIVVNE